MRSHCCEHIRVFMANGAGPGMHHSFMVTLATALSAIGIATLRFNFPFMEHKKKKT